MTFVRFAPLAVPLALVAAAPAEAQQATLAQVEQHLAATQSMTARFTQTDSRQRSVAGTLQMKRPGRIRFEYGGGTNMLLVGDGKSLHFLDYDVGQKSSFRIANSPLSVILAAKPDLGRIARLVKSDDPRVVLVRARDARRPEFGTIVLAFVKAPGAPGGLRLEGWTAFDAQNKRTTVKLSDQRYNVAVADSAFTYAEPKKRGRG